MKYNVGGLERTVRIVLGIILLAVGLIFKSWWGLVGLIPLITGLFRWCPLNALFKRNTSEVN